MEKFNYFSKEYKARKKKLDPKNCVKMGKLIMVCDNPNQADLLRKWMKAGDNFEIK